MTERAVYYCRVSTEEENQMTSILHQRQESVRVIYENGWELVDGYVDEGKSGTTTRYRREYNRMMRDMEESRFDILVVKSQDRLMRNTCEWYRFLDKLTSMKKRLYFYLDRKFYTPEDALLTGIKAILAEDYSRSLSRNINNAHERRQRSGSSVILTSRTWGYDNISGSVVINDVEAKMIHQIYDLAEAGNGSRIIARILAESGYRNRKGGLLAEQTVRRILRNPLYKGTAVMHRQHRDFESKQVEYLDREQWIYHEEAVPAIIDEDQWDRVNARMDQRRTEVSGGKKAYRGRKQNQYPLSGRIQCGICGSVYWRRTHRQASGMCYYWSCSQFLANGREQKSSAESSEEKSARGIRGCDNIHLKECDLEKILEQINEGMGTDALLDRILVKPDKILVMLKNGKKIFVTIKQINYRKREYHVCL